MNLKTAIETFGSQSGLARAIGVTPAMVSQWVLGQRPISALSAKAIEIATKGKVCRHHLRPDIFDAPKRRA